MTFRVALPKLPTMGKVCDTNYRTVCERGRQRNGKRDREREGDSCRGGKLWRPSWHLSRIKCGFCLHFYSLLWRQQRHTHRHTHSDKLWQLWQQQQQQHNTATVSTNPANLFVSTSPRFATLGQLALSGVSDNGQRVRGLPRPAIAPSPSLRPSNLCSTLLLFASVNSQCHKHNNAGQSPRNGGAD